MEEIFDDLICLDEEGESLESSTNENLLEIKQQTLYSRTQPESCVNHRRKHDNIARYLDDKQMSSSKHCCYEKTSSMMPSDFHGSERYSRMKTIENMDELVADTSFLEVDSCEGDDTDCLESGKNICLDQSSRKAENRISVNHVSLTSSTVLPMYDDDEDWPYLSGDVDEEAVRLAASVNLDLVEEAKDGSQQDPQKKRITIEKMTDKWNSEQYYNDDESPCHSKNPDKLDGIWSLHLWKSVYSTSFVSCLISARILEKCCRIMCSLVYFSNTILLSFSLQSSLIKAEWKYLGLFLKGPADKAKD